MMSTYNYQHHPLADSVSALRLVRILPRSSNGLICCEIVQTDLANEPEFEALSYVWGPPGPTRSISVSGLPFMVRKNLWDYLDVMTQTLPRHQSLMFIDQLCINQANIAERNHQVQQMARIYKSAQQVTCWLGLGTALSSNMIKFVKDHSSFSKLPAAFYTGTYDQVTGEFEITSPLGQLIGLDYWRRAWVVQEFLLAKRLSLRWGPQVLSFDTFWAGLAHDVNQLDERGNALEQICNARKEKRTLNWTEILYLLDGRHCEEPTDMVFAMLGLVKGSTINPDYAKTAEEIFDEVAREMIVDNVEEESKLERYLVAWRYHLGLSIFDDVSRYLALRSAASTE